MGGSGSLQKRGNNSWRLVISAGTSSSGKPIQIRKTIHARNKSEAKVHLAEFIAEVNKGHPVNASSNMSFEEFSKQFLSEYAEPHLAFKTVRFYKDMLRRIIPALGKLKLNQITPSIIISFFTDLRKERTIKGEFLSPIYLRHHYRTLYAILQKAVKWDLLSVNPASKVTPPKVPDTDPSSLTKDQLDTILLALSKEPLLLQLLVLIPLETTTGAGELTGLEWPQIDFSNNEIQIIQAAQFQEGKGLVIKETKNKYRMRTICVQDWIMDLLKEYKSEQEAFRHSLGNKWTGGERVFTHSLGGPISPEIASKYLRKFIKKHNLPKFTIHSLRHTSISMMLNQGGDIVSVSREAGHASPLITLKIYAHLFRKSNTDLTQKRSNVLQSLKKKVHTNES